MIVKTGLLVLTNPVQIKQLLPEIIKQIKSTLYIHITSALNEPFTRYKPEIFNIPPKYSKTVRQIYEEAGKTCENLDVKILLSNLKYSTINHINTSSPIETIIFDRPFEKSQVDRFINNCIKNKIPNLNISVLNETNLADNEQNLLDDVRTYKHVVLGGTFDGIHTGHKILLTEAVLYATEKVTVGVTDTNMINSKTLWELIKPCNLRIQYVKQFLNEICPELTYNIVSIQDPFGPTKSDPTMELIIVSAETLRGGEKVNEIRKQNNLPILDIKSIDLIDCCDRQENEETKISSSTNRIRLLGTLLKKPNKDLSQNGPYVIGLTGGIASGKSSVSVRLAALGAAVIDCDKVAHELYQPGKPCFKLVKDAFGDKVIAENGEINRKALGAIVFADKKELDRLNSLLWPAIAEEVKNRITSLFSQNNKIIIIDAAILIPAGWDKMCHEVWTCIIPPEEAISRLCKRNGLSEKEAQSRLTSQVSNSVQVAHAHVVLCTLWEPNYTQKIVERAWRLLNQRVSWKQTNDEQVA